MKDESKAVTIFLESWQRRMLENYLPAMKLPRLPELKRVVVFKWKPGGCLASYKVIQDFRQATFEIYLSDQQRFHIGRELGLPEDEIVALTITPEALREGVVAFG